MKTKNTNPRHCLNCGNEATGDFCSFCGQSTKNYNLSFKQLIHDFLNDYFTFDTKFFRSVFLLIFKPGYLTNQNIAGKRVSYISPMKMYLFISIFSFFLLSISDYKYEIVKIEMDDKPDKEDVTSVETDSLRDEFDQSDSLSTLNIKMDSVKTDSISTQKKSGLKKRLYQKARKAEKNQIELADFILNNISKIMFFILPVFALLLKLIYYRSKILYIKHLIFSLHFHSFIFLLQSLMILSLISINVQNIQIISIVVVLIMAIYLFFSLKNVYTQSIKKTIVKVILLGFTYFLVFAVVIVAFLIMSLLLF